MQQKELLPNFPEVITTERLVLRKCNPVYATQMNMAVRDTFEMLHLWMPWAKKCPSVDRTRTYLNKASADFLNMKEFNFLLFSKNNDQFAGGVGIHRLNWRARRFEFGYWCARQHQGHGYVPEAVVAIGEVLVNTFQAKQLIICCNARNEKSANVALSLGFDLEKTKISEQPDNFGKHYKVLVFSATF